MKIHGMIPMHRPAMGAKTARSLLNSHHLFAALNIVEGHAWIPHARNSMVKMFLDGPCDALLFIDDDIEFLPSHIQAIAARKLPIVGGLYSRKQVGPPSWVARSVDGSMPSSDGLWPLVEVGAGFLMIQRHVFEAIAERMPDLEYDSDDGAQTLINFFGGGVVNRRMLSEDFWFCHIARECGFEIYADTTVQLRHLGSVSYPIDTPAEA